MMFESGVPSNYENKHRVDLIYKAVNQHNARMNFESFLQAIYKVAEFLYRPTELAIK